MTAPLPYTLVLAIDDPALTPLQVRVYGYLHNVLVVDEYREVKRLLLANRFRTDESNVGRYLGILVDHTYLQQGPDGGSPGRIIRTYRLSVPQRGVEPTPLPAA